MKVLPTCSLYLPLSLSMCVWTYHISSAASDSWHAQVFLLSLCFFLFLFFLLAYLFSVFLALFDLFAKLIWYLQTFWQSHRQNKSLCNLLLIKSEYAIYIYKYIFHMYSVHTPQTTPIVFSRANSKFAAPAAICFAFYLQKKKQIFIRVREREEECESAAQIDQKWIILC